MRCLLCYSLLLVVSLSGQSAYEDRVTAAAVSKLSSTLMALKDAAASRASRSQELVDEMMSLAKKDYCPPRLVITRFADKLTSALVGRKLNESQVTTVQQSIVDVIRGSGTSNLSLADRLQETLTVLGISPSETRLIIRDFIAVGEAVRGPDDTPLLP